MSLKYVFRSEVGIAYVVFFVSKHPGLTNVLSVIEVRLPVVSVKRLLCPNVVFPVRRF